MRTVPVCIIGGGPVGMSVALNLHALGVPSMLINRDPQTLWQPRGSSHNSRTMEHYRRMGLARDALTRGTLSISELASATGYSSESAFSSAFRRVVGSSPSAFRDGARASASSRPGLPG